MSGELKPLPLTLAILCGGRSSRFGTDKGLFCPAPYEPPMFVRGVARWGRGFDQVAIVVKNNKQRCKYERAASLWLAPRSRSRLGFVTDCGDGMSGEMSGCYAALMGIISVLQQTQSDRVVVVPVDQLGVRSTHLHLLIEGAGDHVARAFVTSYGNGLLPFPSLWSKNLVDRLIWRVRQGKLSVRAALEDVGADLVSGDRFMEDFSVNINTQNDLREFLS